VPSVAYLTTAGLSEFPVYDALTVEPLRERGYEVESVDWRATEDWSRFEAVLPRSPWDYHLHPEQFFEVLADIDASGAELLNELEIMRWNADKRYLGELAERGVNVVATEFGIALDADRIEELRGRLGSRDLVLKPAVSASAEDTFLLRDGADSSGAVAALDGRNWLAQPFMNGITDEGEYSLVYFGGEWSHALLKIAGPGDFRVQESWGGTIRPVAAEGRLRDRADEVMKALPDSLLYARIDLVRSNGDFALMEAELIEPSLYFGIDPAAPARFADALVERLGAGA
jgi:glutathione synthase/RimK-type ligase-like ATP-grasp enzyme